MYKSKNNKGKNIEFLPLLFLRLILAYGFYNPALQKLQNINGIGEWFESMEIPFPYLNAYMATFTEVLGVIFLFLGFGVRYISVLLMITMVVAIKTVHWEGGFEAGNNGFEIPLYYILMLFTLFVYGAGKYSLDTLVRKKCCKNK